MTEFNRPAPEFGSNPQDLVAVHEAVNAVLDHNRQFSLPSLLDRVFDADSIREDELTKPNASLPFSEWSLDPNRPRLQEEQEMGKGVLGFTAMPALQSIGLELTSPRPDLMIHNGDHLEYAGEVDTQLVDGAAFCAFLGRVAAHNEHLKTFFKPTLETIAESVFSAFSDNTAIEYSRIPLGAESRAPSVELTSYAGTIARRFEALNIDERYPKMFRLCEEYAAKGIAQEWIMAYRLSLLDRLDQQQAEGWGPALWQSLGIEQCSTHWEKVVELLDRTSTAPKGQDFYRLLVHSARANLTDAKRICMEMGYGQEFAALFDRIRQAIRHHKGLLPED